MERIELIEYGLDCPEIVISDTELIDCIKQMGEGEELWYRDYDNTGEDCISLYKCITKTKICGREVYVISFKTDEDAIVNSDAKIIDANIKAHCNSIDGRITQEIALKNALQEFSEWHVYYGMMIIERPTFDEYFDE